MDPIAEALELLRRQAQLETGLRQPGGIRVTGVSGATEQKTGLSGGV